MTNTIIKVICPHGSRHKIITSFASYQPDYKPGSGICPLCSFRHQNNSVINIGGNIEGWGRWQDSCTNYNPAKNQLSLRPQHRTVLVDEPGNLEPGTFISHATHGAYNGGKKHHSSTHQITRRVLEGPANAYLRATKYAGQLEALSERQKYDDKGHELRCPDHRCGNALRLIGGHLDETLTTILDNRERLHLTAQAVQVAPLEGAELVRPLEPWQQGKEWALSHWQGIPHADPARTVQLAYLEVPMDLVRAVAARV